MDIDSAAAATRIMRHPRMLRMWRAGLAEPVSSRLIDYLSYTGVWWRRSGTTWTAIPDGPLTLVLSAGQARLALAARNAGLTPPARIGDPWSALRNRHRSGGACGKTPAFMPMRATDLRPHQPVACRAPSSA